MKSKKSVFSLLLLFLLATMLSSVVAAETTTAEKSKLQLSESDFPKGRQYDDWEDWLDYMNLYQPLNITKFSTIYIMKVDDSQVVYPDKSDNQYLPLYRGISSFNQYLEKKLNEKFPHIKVVQVESFNDLQMKANSLLLVPKFDKVDMGSRAARVWVGFGAGAQKMRVSGYVVDNEGRFYYNFWHQRVSTKSKKYDRMVENTMEVLSEDFILIFEKLIRY